MPSSHNPPASKKTARPRAYANRSLHVRKHTRAHQVPARSSANPSLIEHRALAVGVYHGLKDHNSDGSTSAATGYHRAKARQIPLGDRTPDLAARIQAIDDGLETIAREVIVHHLDISRPENASFLASPDAREQHQTQWHQWGILTHTRRFLHHYEVDIPRYLSSWGLESQVDAVLTQPINGASRADLLRAAILLHDLGKFSARRQGRGRFHFAQHEEQSGNIIRSELDLPGLGFTPDQTEYIARAAQDHFVLGVLRKAARERGEYDEEFPHSGLFRNLSLEIKASHPDDFVEIGVLFLGDSLAKVDPASGPERAVSQYNVNIAVAREYLRIVLDTASL